MTEGSYEGRGMKAADGRTWNVVCRRSTLGDSIDYRVDRQPYEGTGLIPGGKKSEHVVNVSDRDSLVVQFTGDGACKVKLPNNRETVVLTFVKTKRAIRLEIDVEDHPTLRRFVADKNLKLVCARIAEGYRNAGVDISFSDRHDWIPGLSSGEAWTPRTLNERFNRYFDLRDADPDVPTFHMLLLYRTTARSLYGVMYDTPADDTPREGAACFFELFENYEYKGISLVDNIAYTIIHEIGHCLNLAHSFQKENLSSRLSNRDEALSFMNYEESWAQATGRTEADYWYAFLPRWNFDEPELHHLWHAKPKAIFPGKGTLKFKTDGARATPRKKRSTSTASSEVATAAGASFLCLAAVTCLHWARRNRGVSADETRWSFVVLAIGTASSAFTVYRLAVARRL